MGFEEMGEQIRKAMSLNVNRQQPDFNIKAIVDEWIQQAHEFKSNPDADASLSSEAPTADPEPVTAAPTSESLSLSLRSSLLARIARRSEAVASTPKPELADWAFASVHGSASSRTADAAASPNRKPEDSSADVESPEESQRATTSWSSWLTRDEQEEPPPARKWPGLIE